ncbi:hypothetical protein [Planctomyces sp. SH-PL62]|uniref:hypothetical protein n=1 Tax=Planctomyces sp. SH-PL62 TaxID=1636152 RepID=UPI00078BDAF2|nr:hypothetical protein [Planctomyces sp. SH-PL62]AMV36773.1 hypothetical protein VT85_05035 [Planctomyces sp. SH-PL62]
MILSEWLDNPIFVKHVRSRLRPQAFTTSAAVTVLISLCILYGTFQGRAFASGDGFTALLVLQFVVLVLMGSTQVGASVGGARTSGILDFHRVSPLSRWELSLGFLFGAPVREYLLTALTIPFMLFCVMMGFPDFRGLVQAELLLLATAWTMHAISLLGGLALKSGVSGQNALGFTIIIGIFVVGPLFGAFSVLKGLIDGDLHLGFFGIPLPWLAFVLLHLAALLAFFLLAATRKIGSERLHGLTKPQALAASATLGLLAIGGAGNWDGNGVAHLIVLYILVIASLFLAALATPTLAEFDKGLLRARKLEQPRPSVWSDFAPNRPILVAICGVLLVAGSILGTTVSETAARNVPTRGGFPLAVANGVLVVAYFGLACQYFLIRFGRRASNYFGLFLFVAWVLPLILGVITIVSIGNVMNGDARPAMIFSATPLVGIIAASGAFENDAGSGPATVAITLSLLFTFVFNMLYTKAVRRARSANERAGDDQAGLDPDLIQPEAKPAAVPG